jgi:hypothetical protein
MKKVLFGLLLALTSLSALADWTFSDGPLTVIARKSPCPPVMLELVNEQKAPDGVENWFEADVLFEGKHLSACWAPHKDKVLLIDETGDAGFIHMELFKTQKGV